MNPSFNAQQVISALAHLDASHLIIGTETNLPRAEPRSNVPLLQQLVLDLGAQKLESEAVPSLRQVVLVDNSNGRINASLLRPMTQYSDVLLGNPVTSLPSSLTNHPDEVVNIQFTSGTTSTPKAASLSHRSILNNGNSIGDRMLLTEKDIICCPPPLFHCFGSILGYMASATHGSSIVFPTESFDPAATLTAVQNERCTALYGVPTMFIAELDLLRSGAIALTEGFSSLRTGIAAGSSIPAELMRKLHRTLNLTELTICYGMTETSPVSCMTTTDDPLPKRIDSVGKLLPHVEAKVVDPTPPYPVLPIGQRGELAVSGYLVMKGYWNDPARTAEVMIADADGKTWMHTGDEAEMDAEGYVKITGRIKDLIIRGGENIHPLEVENCLLAHPGVKEVSVVGVPDDKYGETVAAFVVPSTNHHSRGDGGAGGRPSPTAETAEEMRTWVREKLSRHLVPKYVLWVDGFPKTASGKIQKFILKDQAVEMLRGGSGAGNVRMK